jgi:U6 snRNA-associated Sm-like protein LSm7
VGTLKGYDQLMNLVLDDVKETMRGKLSQHKLASMESYGFADDEGNEKSRSLGLIVARGTLLVLISPVDGSEEIANPFQQGGEDE